MSFKDFQPTKVATVVQSASEQETPFIGLRVTNKSASWKSLVVRYVNNSSTEVTLNFAPGTVTFEPGRFDKINAGDAFDADFSAIGYIDA